MKFNGAIFSKPQQDQLKEIIGNELESVVEKVNDVDSRMLNYAGDWVSDNEYHVNDVVTWAHNGHLYEVIKAHTSSASLDPDNPEYYKAMTSSNYIQYTLDLTTGNGRDKAIELCTQSQQGKNIVAIVRTGHYRISYVGAAAKKIVLCTITEVLLNNEVHGASIKLLNIEPSACAITRIKVASDGTTVDSVTTGLNSVIFLVEA